jgi:magnesium-transporting ATPase (P-type)
VLVISQGDNYRVNCLILNHITPIPADLQLITTNNLRCLEAFLTPRTNRNRLNSLNEKKIP